MDQPKAMIDFSEIIQAIRQRQVFWAETMGICGGGKSFTDEQKQELSQRLEELSWLEHEIRTQYNRNGQGPKEK